MESKNNDFLSTSARKLLCGNILPFWIERMQDRQRGGFYGRIAGDGVLESEAPKGVVLNARILWSFSAAYRVVGDPLYLEMAERAREYLMKHFFDPVHGGVYWTVDADGRPLDTKKQIYAQGFAIYALSEYVRATGDKSALEPAIRLYRLVEEHAHDTINCGYWEAFTREWQEIQDMRLSDKDANERKTMNTHLHVIEPYTNLLRVWPDEGLKQSIRELLSVFEKHIVEAETGHLGLFFDDLWNPKTRIVSYGHDIEASWLLHESAGVLNDPELLDRTSRLALNIAQAACEGLASDGSLYYEYDDASGRSDTERHWWVQAEGVVGFLNAWQHLGMEQGRACAENALRYILSRLVDREGGEWWWSILPDGGINRADDKAGLWKCPYHNTRMCLELIERLK